MIGWIDTVIQGVLLGGLYALFAAGLSLIFGIMRLVNLAHGDLIVLAAFVVLAISNVLGVSPFLATLLAALLVTFGLSIIIQNGLLEVFSADSQRLKAGAIETASIHLGGGIALGTIQLITLVSAIGVILALNLILYRTELGRAFRATSDDPEIAQLMGI